MATLRRQAQLDSASRPGRISSEKSNIFALVFGEPGASLREIDPEIDGMWLALTQQAATLPLSMDQFITDGVGF